MYIPSKIKEKYEKYEGHVKSMNTKIPKNSRNNEIDLKEKYVIFETYTVMDKSKWTAEKK